MSVVPLDSSRLAGQQLAGVDLLAVVDFDAGLGGQVVEVENFAVGGILDGDARVAFALVLDDDEACFGAALGLRFSARTVSPSSMSS